MDTIDNILSKKYYITLNAKENKLYTNKELSCRKNDSILFYITVQEDKLIKDLSNCKVSVMSVNDKRKIEQIIDSPTVENGVLVFSPKKEFTSIQGTLNTEITIFDDDESITVQGFLFTITNVLSSDIPEENKDSVDTIIELNRVLNSYKEEVKSLRDSIDELRLLINGESNHVHLNKETLDSITDVEVTKWNDASEKVNNMLHYSVQFN